MTSHKKLLEQINSLLENDKNRLYEQLNNRSSKELLEELNTYHAELEAQNYELSEKLREIEQLSKRYHNLFQNNPAYIVIIDESYRFLDYNDRARNLFEIYNFPHPLSIRSYILPKDAMAFHQLIDTVKEEGYAEAFISLKMHSTEQRHMHIVGSRAEDSTKAFQLVMQDITELTSLKENLEVRIEQELQKNQTIQAELHKKSLLESQQNLLRNIAHHWRQPLNVVSMTLGAIENKLEDHLDQESKEAFDLMIKSMQTLSKNINEFSKISNPKQEIIQFDLVELIWDLHYFINPEKDGLNIQCGCNLPQSPVMYVGQKSTLSQILITLFNNAVESIERQKKLKPDISEHIIAFNLLEKPDTLEIHVRDTGDPFNEQALEHLFEPYNSQHKLYAGSGLSLFNAHNLLKAVGGDLKAHNLPEGGSEVICTLERYFFDRAEIS